MLPIWALVVVSHAIAFAIYTFEDVRAQFPLLGFELWWVYLEVGFAAPSHVSMMLDLVRTATFLTFGAMSFACEGCMTPFPAVVALRHS